MRTCLSCKSTLSKTNFKYCSNKCQLKFQHDSYIEAWKAGEKSGSRGVKAMNISRHIKRYLATKYGEECSLCGWNKVNVATNAVPLEIDHIDGDSSNNNEDNLRLICPNCHSLTLSYRNLNRGKGREWRRMKYSKHI